MSIGIRLCLVILVLMWTMPVLAASSDDSFIVQTQIGNDIAPPSQPTGVEATPVASTQIDLSWLASTDDTGVTGYQLYRDMVLVTTTSLLNYSDTGLTASTTYSYTVVAFDAFANFSSSSIPVATTTFPLPIIPTATSTPGENSSGATRTPVSLVSFSLVSNTNAARVQFETSVPTQFILRYGKSSTYDDGIVRGELFDRNHETLLTGLDSGTKYHYELFGYDRFGRETLLKRGLFITDTLPDTNAPANVAGFKAQSIQNTVLLSWQSPIDEDYAYVRILRNHLFFPTDPNDGFLVYEGRGEAFTDENALSQYGTQYYTIFTYDTAGNRSSGAVAIARILGSSGESILLPSSSSSTSTTTDSIKVGFSDVEIEQNGEVYQLYSDRIKIDSKQAFTIRIPYNLFPQHLKVITVTLTHPTHKETSFSFLLQANEDFTYYEATLAGLPVEGVYAISFSVFNVFSNEMFNFGGTLEAVTPQKIETSVPENGFVIVQRIVGLSLLVLVILCMYYLLRKREDKHL